MFPPPASRFLFGEIAAPVYSPDRSSHILQTSETTIHPCAICSCLPWPASQRHLSMVPWEWVSGHELQHSAGQRSRPGGRIDMHQYREGRDRHRVRDRPLAIPQHRSRPHPRARRARLHRGRAGVTVLASIDGTTLRPYLALLLTLVGLRMLIRFIRLGNRSDELPTGRAPIGTVKPNPRGVAMAALLGGVTNGLIGAWGPIVTPYLLNRAVRPRFAIGSVNTAEVAVASASAFTLIGSLGIAGVDGLVLLSMLAGGVVAAPLAAWVIRYVPARPMGIAVAVLLLMTNARQLVGWAGFTLGPLSVAVYTATIAFVVFAVLSASGFGRKEASIP